MTGSKWCCVAMGNTAIKLLLKNQIRALYAEIESKWLIGLIMRWVVCDTWKQIKLTSETGNRKELVSVYWIKYYTLFVENTDQSSKYHTGCSCKCPTRSVEKETSPALGRHRNPFATHGNRFCPAPSAHPGETAVCRLQTTRTSSCIVERTGY